MPKSHLSIGKFIGEDALVMLYLCILSIVLIAYVIALFNEGKVGRALWQSTLFFSALCVIVGIGEIYGSYIAGVANSITDFTNEIFSIKPADALMYFLSASIKYVAVASIGSLLFAALLPSASRYFAVHFSEDEAWAFVWAVLIGVGLAGIIIDSSNLPMWVCIPFLFGSIFYAERVMWNLLSWFVEREEKRHPISREQAIELARVECERQGWMFKFVDMYSVLGEQPHFVVKSEYQVDKPNYHIVIFVDMDNGATRSPYAML